jgi:1,4-dihydroxy-2-naphthoate octaprenyltransferase
MKIAIAFFSILSLVSAAFLIKESLLIISSITALFYLILAFLCVIAAITYTMGKKAYGYYGLGDLFVFVFFGLVSVLGVYTLYTNHFSFLNLLPAFSIGLLSTAVLNMNNLRDQINDKVVGKNTLVVRLGFEKAKLYHSFLIITPILLMFLFSILKSDYVSLLSLGLFIPLLLHLKFVYKVVDFKDFDSQLKKIALITFFFSIAFSVLINI